MACFQWKHSGRVVFIFSSKTSILVWCGLKQAETEPKTSYVSDPRVSLDENVRFQKWAFSACFQAENDPFINSGTGRVVPEFIDPVFTKTSPKRSFSLNRKRAFWLVFAKTGSIISGIVFIFSSKTRVLVWCGLKQAENGPKTSYVSDPRLSLSETLVFRNEHFQLENNLKTILL